MTYSTLGQHGSDTIILADGTPFTMPILRAETTGVTGKQEPVFTTRFGQPYTMEEIVVRADEPKAPPWRAILPLALIGLVMSIGAN
ncbi:MAG: hypothetical protein GY906_38680 [bacterium]|nr:hypothetical protein [bacterium]